MTGFSLPKNYTDNPESPVRRAWPRVVPPLALLPAQEPIQEAPLVIETMAEKTLREFSIPSTDIVDQSEQMATQDDTTEISIEIRTYIYM